MEIILAKPRGFCAGVDRAIEIVEKALELYGAPIYVRHEVVHNEYVVKNLEQRGAIFLDDIEEIPEGSICIFSAHGVSKQIRERAKERDFTVFDATCPLVTKVHMEVARHARDNREVILIGHAGHPEVEGTLGQYRSAQGTIYLVESVEDAQKLEVKDPSQLAFVTQTTLSMDDTQQIIAALQQRFPVIKAPRRDDICYATQNRQDAVKALAEHCELVLVVGSKSSSNSNRLRELAESCGTKAYLIDGAKDLQQAWLSNIAKIGITAGASAPEVLVQEVIAQLKDWGATGPTQLSGIEETITFNLPKELRQAMTEQA